MKKSTLITTIAMIVVVVVALSTATYAWFTSQQNTVVEMTVSTSAEAGWALLANSTSIGDGHKQASPSSTAMSFDATQGLSPLNSGLWCPTGDISATLSSNTGDCTFEPGVAFFSANQKAEGNNKNVVVTASPAYYQPEVIRIARSGADKQGTLTITISFKDTDQGSGVTKKTVLSSAIAAAGLRFVIVGYDGSSSSVVASTGYYKATSAAYSGASIANINTMSTDDHTVAYELVSADGHFTQPSGQDLTDAANIVANKGSTSGGFLYSEAGNADYGIEADCYYAQYLYDLGTITSGAGKNFAIYYWLDGALLSTSAGTAGLSLHFSVGDHV